MTSLKVEYFSVFFVSSFIHLCIQAFEHNWVGNCLWPNHVKSFAMFFFVLSFLSLAFSLIAALLKTFCCLFSWVSVFFCRIFLSSVKLFFILFFSLFSMFLTSSFFWSFYIFSTSLNLKFLHLLKCFNFWCAEGLVVTVVNIIEHKKCTNYV